MGKPDTRLVYRVAAIIWSRENHYAYDIQEFSTIDIELYKVTEGESDVHLIKKMTGYLFQGIKPDIMMRYQPVCGYYSDYEPGYRFFPIYEFYFDKPVSVTGTFLATATLNSDGHLFGDVAQWGNLLRGYEAWIQKEKQKIYALWYGNLDDEDFYYDSAGLPAPDIELQGIVMRKAQWLFPILVPEGTTAIPAVEGETFGVQLKPNPAAEWVVVAAEVGIRCIEVVDMTGRTFIRRPCDALPLCVTLDVKALPHGIYAVKVDTPQGVATKKLAVE